MGECVVRVTGCLIKMVFPYLASLGGSTLVRYIIIRIFPLSSPLPPPAPRYTGMRVWFPVEYVEGGAGNVNCLCLYFVPQTCSMYVAVHICLPPCIHPFILQTFLCFKDCSHHSPFCFLDWAFSDSPLCSGQCRPLEGLLASLPVFIWPQEVHVSFSSKLTSAS